MLSGQESTWRLLEVALPRLEALKAKSGILYHQDPLSIVIIHHRLYCGMLIK